MWVLHDSLLYSGLERDNFLNADISQGSVATCLSCGGRVKDDFVANLLMNLTVKQTWKSVSLWRRYGQDYSGLFFLTRAWFATAGTAGAVWGGTLTGSACFIAWNIVLLCCTVSVEVSTKAWYMLAVFTGRVDGPCSRVVWTGAVNTAREHGCRKRHPCSTPVFTAHEQGPWNLTGRVAATSLGNSSCRQELFRRWDSECEATRIHWNNAK